MTSAAWRPLTSLDELTLLFLAALRGSFRRPSYWRELLERCRFILTADFPPLLLTGLGFTIVSLEAGHFFLFGCNRPDDRDGQRDGDRGRPGGGQAGSELEALVVIGLCNLLFVVVPRAFALMLKTAPYNFSMLVFTMVASYLVAVAVVGVKAGAGGHENGSRQQRQDDTDDMFD